MSLQQRIFKDFDNNERWTSHHQKFGQEGTASAGRRYPLVIKSLGLLNVVLLTAAVVIGIYCANDHYSQVPQTAVATLLAELNFYRNTSHIIQARLEAEKALMKERANSVQIRLEVKQQKVVMDNILKQIGIVQTEKRHLQSNTTSLMESCNKCQPGWVFLKSNCYYFSSQNKSITKNNWFESRRDCVSQGGDLLVIDSVEKELYISDSHPKPTSSEPWWQLGSWIGLTRNRTLGTWNWVSNTTADTWFWKHGQPKSEGPQSGDCAAFSYNSDPRSSWYNGNCQEHRLYWICEAKSK